MKNYIKVLSLSVILLFTEIGFSQTYKIVDTDVIDHYNNNSVISAPTTTQPFYGQDACYNGHQPSYTNNGDGTVTDNVTGLMWEQDMGSKISYTDAFIKASNSTLGGHTDWRVPTIKELYSLALFTGRCFGDYAMYKFIDTNYFNQPIGNTAIGEREIDAQTWSSTQYAGLTMNGDSTVFGYNFVDGRLKGYPKYDPPTFTTPKTMYFRMVRDNPQYGINNFNDNGDGTISDNATELMWQQADDGTTRNWKNSLSYCENLSLSGYTDWRLPNAKELHSIVDYTRCPDATNSPAIDLLFSCSTFNNPNGDLSYGYYWTSSPLMDGPNPYSDAVYICFGEAQGQMQSPPNSQNYVLFDTHGAGAQRNDPKKQASGTTYPTYWGPQGDIVYVDNYARCVRDDNGASSLIKEPNIYCNVYPNPVSKLVKIESNETIEKVIFYNLIGEKIIESRIHQKKKNIITSELTPGKYLIKIILENGDKFNKEIIVSKF